MSAAIPIREHKARGTYRPKRHANKLAVPDERLGEAPAWFDEVQRAEWQRLAAIDHIKAINAVAVEHACILYGRFVEDAKGTRAMTASERQTFHSVYMQLALTPASAAKVPAAPVEKADDPWARLG